MAVERTADKTFSLPLGQFLERQTQNFEVQRNRARDFTLRDFSQRVINEGLSYDEQKDFFQNLVEREQGKVFVDTDFIKTLKKSVTDLNKLIRADKFKAEFTDSLDELVSGHISINDHIDFLQDELNTTIDADLKDKIRQGITNGKQQQYQSQKTIINNQVNFALNDKSEGILGDMLSKVQKKKNNALLSGDDEWASALDVQSLALRKQLAQSQLEKQINENISRSLSDPNPVNLLTQLNTRVTQASGDVPITINGVTFDNPKAFWESEKLNYLGSGQFFNDLNNFWKRSIDATQARSKDSLVSEMKDIKKGMESLLSNPDIAQFEQQAADTIDLIMGYGAEKVGRNIVNKAKIDFDFSGAAQQLSDFNKFSGIDMTDSYQEIVGEISNLNFNQAQEILRVANDSARAAGRDFSTMADLNFAIQATPNLNVSPETLATQTPEETARGLTTDTAGTPPEKTKVGGEDIGGTTGQRDQASQPQGKGSRIPNVVTLEQLAKQGLKQSDIVEEGTARFLRAGSTFEKNLSEITQKPTIQEKATPTIATTPAPTPTPKPTPSTKPNEQGAQILSDGLLKLPTGQRIHPSDPNFATFKKQFNL